MFVLCTVGYGQLSDSLIAGKWVEVHKKKKGFYIPLHLQLNMDNTARYLNLYPEKSYNLKWALKSDSILTLTNGIKYKVVYLHNHLLKLRKGTGKKSKFITLKELAEIPE